MKKFAAKTNGKEMGWSLMAYFYGENAEVLLPIALEKGLAEFSKAFCQIHHTNPGHETGPALQPNQVEKAFGDIKFFQHHELFYEQHAQKAFDAIGGKEAKISESDLETFYELIKESLENTSLMKSKYLDGKQRRIICRMLLPKQFAQATAKDADFVSEIFLDQETNEGTVVETSGASDSPVESSTAGSKIKNPDREVAYKVILEMTTAASKGDQISPTNPAVRAEVARQFPKMADWAEANKHWISKKLSIAVKKFGLTTIRTPRSESVSKTESLTPERKQAKKVMQKFQGRLFRGKVQYFTTKEIIPKIVKQHPKLTDWVADPQNRRWITNIMSGLKFHGKDPAEAANTTDKGPEGPTKVVGAPKASASPMKKASSKANTVGNDLLSQGEAILAKIRSGQTSPIEILDLGEPVLKLIGDELAKLQSQYDSFDNLSKSLNSGLEGYRELVKKLGIKK